MPDSAASQAESQSTVRRATRNFIKLLRGRGFAAVLELATVALLARELSPGPFGNIVLIQTYVLVFNGLFGFKLYEVLVRFGVPLLEVDDRASFRQLLRLTLFVDIASSIVATITAIIAALATSRLLGWEDGMAQITMVYSMVLLTYGFGTAKGVLRIFDRYDILGTQLTIAPALRLIGVILVMVLNPTLMMFVIALTIATAIGNIYLIIQGWRELRRQVGALKWHGRSLRGWRKQFPGLRKFMIVLYWQGNIDMMPTHISTLLAGTMLGSAGAGLLRLARESTKIISKPGALLRQVLFPDLVRMWVRGTGAFRLVLIRALIFAVLFGLLFVLASMFGGSALLAAALGEDYAAAAPLMTLLLLAATIELMATVLRAAGYAIGDADTASYILKLHLLSSTVYLTLFATLTPKFNLIGPGIAACIAALIPLGGIGILVVKGMRDQQAPTAPRPR